MASDSSGRASRIICLASRSHPARLLQRSSGSLGEVSGEAKVGSIYSTICSTGHDDAPVCLQGDVIAVVIASGAKPRPYLAVLAEGTVEPAVPPVAGEREVRLAAVVWWSGDTSDNDPTIRLDHEAVSLVRA